MAYWAMRECCGCGKTLDRPYDIAYSVSIDEIALCTKCMYDFDSGEMSLPITRNDKLVSYK